MSMDMAARIARAAEKIEALRRPDSLVLGLFTDLHTPSPEHESVAVLTEALHALTGAVRCDAVIDLGDNPSMLGRDTHITNDDLAAYFDALLGKLHAAAGCPLLCVHGNHDAVGTDFFKPDYWNRLTKHKYGNTAAVFGEEGSYYYVDFDKADTRIVALSVPSESDIEVEFPTPVWGFGKAQLAWLEKTALATDKHVILLIHVPFYDEYRGDMEATLGVWTGERAAVSYISALCGWIDDVEEAAAIVNRFAERTGKLVGCFSGHTHADSLRGGMQELDGYKNPLVCPQAVTRSFWRAKHGADECPFAMDVLVWTPSEKRLELVRIGDGTDRRIL